MDVGQHPAARVVNDHRLAVRLFDQQPHPELAGKQYIGGLQLGVGPRPGLSGNHDLPPPVLLSGAGQDPEPQRLPHPAAIHGYGPPMIPHFEADVKTVIRPEAHSAPAGEEAMAQFRKGGQQGALVAGQAARLQQNFAH